MRAISLSLSSRPYLTILAKTPNLNWEVPLAMDFIWARSSLALALESLAEAEEAEADEEEAVLLIFLFSTVGMAMALRLKASRSLRSAASISARVGVVLCRD